LTTVELLGDVPLLATRLAQDACRKEVRSLSYAITESQLRYVRWLASKVRCPIPFPECINSMEASWLIWDLRMRLAKKRAYMLIQ